MKKFSRMILDSLKVTDDDDVIDVTDEDEIELRKRKEKRQRQKEERKAVAMSKKEAPAMRRYEPRKYDDDDYDEEEDEVAKARASRVQEYRERAQENNRASNDRSYNQPKTQPQPQYRAPQMRSQVSSTDVCILRPKRFEECQEIIDVLKSGRVIFLTFDSTNPAIANRIMDFSFGAVYALDAQIIQLSGNNFVIAPEDAEISGEYINSLTAANYGSWNGGMDSNGKR